MRKTIALLCALLVSGGLFCKKQQSEQAATSLAKKYAKYRVVLKKDAELTTFAALLEKGEDVDLIQELEQADKAGKKSTLAKVRLTDGTEGYVDVRHLADKVIVFIEETPVFARPTLGSRVHCKVPKGTMAFVIGEQANWVKVYAGKIGDIWVTDHWAQGGYSTDPQIILQARTYEQAVEQLSSKKENERKAGQQKLSEISQGESMFASLAREKLEAFEAQQTQKEEGGTEAASQEMK